MLSHEWTRFACQNIKETFTVSRPHIAESFINQLMSTHLEDATSISFRIDHLTACVNQLATDIMSREKLVFEKYALFRILDYLLFTFIVLYVFKILFIKFTLHNYILVRVFYIVLFAVKLFLSLHYPSIIYLSKMSNWMSDELVSLDKCLLLNVFVVSLEIQSIVCERFLNIYHY